MNAKEKAEEIADGILASIDTDAYNFSGKVQGKLLPLIVRALNEARIAGMREAAKIAEAFVHTRRDCENGTTTLEIAEDIRQRADEIEKRLG